MYKRDEWPQYITRFRETYMQYDLQKASMWKRISAFLFDGILLGVAAVLFALAISGISGYDRYNDIVRQAYDRYGKEYGVDMHMPLAEYKAMSAEEQQNMDRAFAALNADRQAVEAQQKMMQMSLTIASFSILAAFGLLEFLIPLLLKNGQTMGKKIFGIAVMHTNGVKISGPMLFARAVLGKYAVETMVPVYILVMMGFGRIGVVGPAVLLLILLLQAGLLLGTQTRSALHDVLAKTVTVDMGSQMIFETEEAMIAWKKKMHAEKVARQSY